MPIPKDMVCDCLRCGHSWVKRLLNREGGDVVTRPARCPKCKSPYWDTMAGELRRGPKPKATKRPKKAKAAK